MSYLATVITRTDGRWSAAELDLDDVEDIDAIAEEVRGIDHEADLRVLLLEEEDEYLAIVRVDGEDAEPRVFLSEGRAADVYPLAAMLVEAIDDAGRDDDDPVAAVPDLDIEVLDDPGLGAELGAELDDVEDVAGPRAEPEATDDEESTGGHPTAPIGDAALLADLGTSRPALLELCRRESTLPSDVAAAVCENAGCFDAFDELRTG
ncbi:MAG: hypothetical protein ACR2FF_09560 [Mycobacteriales bacterium]|nr:MAG: hypothetical protein DLM56_15280 [Pseudonocardiales bacterium]